jgi:predicted site-specific integrase-resolvase
MQSGAVIPEPSALLTPVEAGLRLGVSSKALERWRSHGRGPAFVRLSRKVIRYRAQDVDDFVAGRVVPGAGSD